MKFLVKKDVYRELMMDMMKSHIKGYTKKNGVYVSDHIDSRSAAGKLKIHFYIKQNGEKVGSYNKRKVVEMANGGDIYQCDTSDFKGETLDDEYNDKDDHTPAYSKKPNYKLPGYLGQASYA